MEVTDINSNTHTKTAKEVYKSLWFKRKATPVVCLTTGVVYSSANEAERKTGIWGKSILNCCDGKTKQASGKQWAYV